jgi:hypothetical protein
MAFETAIQGLGQLQRSFEGIAERKQKEKLQESSQKFETSERLGKEDFLAKESALERKSRLELEKISQGPKWAEIRMAQEKYRKALEAGESMAAGMAETETGKTPIGIGIQGLAKSGNIDAAVNALGSAAGRQSALVSLAEKAALSKDPEFINTVNNVLNSYYSMSENESYAKSAGDAWVKAQEEKYVPFKWNPKEAWTGMTQVLKDQIGYEVSAEPLANRIVDIEKDDPGWWSRNRSQITESLATHIKNTDAKMARNPDAATRVAQVFLDRLYTGGSTGVLEPGKVDEYGQPIYDEFKGFQDISIELNRSRFLKDFAIPYKTIEGQVIQVAPGETELNLTVSQPAVKEVQATDVMKELMGTEKPQSAEEAVTLLNKIKDNLLDSPLYKGAKKGWEINSRIGELALSATKTVSDAYWPNIFMSMAEKEIRKEMNKGTKKPFGK